MKRIFTLITLLSVLVACASFQETTQDTVASCKINEFSSTELMTMKLNFKFDEITLDQAIRLLGDVADLEVLRPASVDWSFKIKTNYSQRTWYEIVTDICTTQNLTCWIKYGTLYAGPESHKEHMRLAVEHALCEI